MNKVPIESQDQKMRTHEEFREQSIKHGIEWWPIHNCSICGYECGFILGRYENYEVVYDSGCFCTHIRNILARNWESIAEQYNMNIKNIETIKRYDEFWKFNE